MRHPSGVRTIATAAAAVLLATTLTGCGGGDKPEPKAGPTAPPTSPPATGMVQGRLVTVGGPAPGTAKPVPGTVTFQGPDGSTTRTEVDESGRFAIGLYPGSYQIRGTSPTVQDGKLECSTEKPRTTLTAGRTVTADVLCSIR